MASAAGSAQSAQFSFPPLTTEEEEAIVDARLNNDEKALRRVIRKYHTFASAPADAEDAREAFLIELASFELSLKKSLLVCEAEARQVEEYERERRRIATEHEKLRGQIEQLKTSLEEAQMLRKRKIEYDVIAEKVNALPSRDELIMAIDSLENDMAAIRAEHETQDRVLSQQRAALHEVVAGLNALRLIGKDSDALEGADSPAPAADEREDGEDDSAGATATAPPSTLNPAARPFVPPSRTSTPNDSQRRSALAILTPLSSATSSARPSPLPPRPATSKDDDIEMGEVSQGRGRKKKVREEELEEGEATDASSELSDPPED